MKITDFKSDLMKPFIDALYISSPNAHIYSEHELSELLKPINIHFVLNDINRLQSTLLCELGDSYVQQSQRYCIAGKYSFPSIIPDDLLYDTDNLLKRTVQLYKDMIELKPDAKSKSRPSKDDFLHGIPLEDARYILPLCMSTNISVSMSGDKLIDLYRLMNMHPYTFFDIKKELDTYIPTQLLINFNSIISKDSNLKYKLVQPYISKLNSMNPVIWIDLDNDTDTVAIGALTSTSATPPREVIDEWGKLNKDPFDIQVKEEKLIQRVHSYGHTSIDEQSRTTFSMMCSLSAYHQVIRHRIQNINREDIFEICRDRLRTFYVPESIQNSKFNTQVSVLMNDYMSLFMMYSKKYSNEFITLFLPNSTMIKFIVSSNARNDCWILNERLCLTAQTEIRELFNKKFKILYNMNPILYDNALPPCVTTGKCKEGKLTCGKIKEMKELYKDYI